MKSSTRTIMAFIALILTTASFAGSQNQPEPPETKTITISGSVDLTGVIIEGFPGGPIASDSNGNYRATVKSGWTGMITPIKEGYKFDPPNRTYADVTGNLDNQDYWPTQIDIAPMFDGSVSRRVLIIPTSETKIRDFEQTTEDMLVMLHIFDEKIQDEPDSIRGVFRNYGEIFGRDNKTSKAIYIQGYGVLFLLEVDLPLVFPPEPQQEQPEQAEEEDVDPVWRQAREQVFSPKDDAPGMMYDTQPEDIQKRVENLKNELIRTLKHASNIRHTESDDWVVLSLTGWSESTGQISPFYRYRMMENRTNAGRRSRSVDRRGGSDNTSGRTTRSGMGGRGGMSGGYAGGSYGGGGFAAGSSSSSFSSGSFSAGSYGRGGFGGMEVRGQMDISSAAVLTICARKSDVDAFAKDELDFEQFRQRINVFVY